MENQNALIQKSLNKMEENKKEPKEAKAKVLTKYKVLKPFTGAEGLHRQNTEVKLDADADTTKDLLNSKYIR